MRIIPLLVLMLLPVVRMPAGEAAGDRPNVILVKACQNSQTDSWARQWDFQLRVCDPDGAAILSSNRDQ